MRFAARILLLAGFAAFSSVGFGRALAALLWMAIILCAVRNRRGQWVAQEQNGLYGGVFVSCAQAIKFARLENGQHLETIIELPREIELDVGLQPHVGHLSRECVDAPASCFNRGS